MTDVLICKDKAAELLTEMGEGPLTIGRIVAWICDREGLLTRREKMDAFDTSYNYIPEIINGRRRAPLRQAVLWMQRLGYPEFIPLIARISAQQNLDAMLERVRPF